MAEETMMNLKKKVLALQQGPRAQTLGAKDVMVQRVRVRTPASALVGGAAAERRVPDQFVIQDADPDAPG